MNTYLEVFFWAVAAYAISMGVVHLANTLKKKDRKETDFIKSIVYLAGAITLGILLVYKPFGVHRLLKARKSPVEDISAVISTSLSSGTSVSTGGTTV